MFSDSGTEFKNQTVKTLLRKLRIGQFFARNPDTKAAICERFNRTLKERMFRLMTYKGTRRYIDDLESIVKSYNNSVHRTIGMRPVDVSEDNEAVVFQNIFRARNTAELSSLYFKDVQRFSVGDSVRAKYTLKPMDKSYYPLFGDKVYTVSRVIKGPRRYLYKLKNWDNKEENRSFYAEELQLVDPDTAYRIEKVIKTRGNKSLVKFLNHPFCRK